MSALVLLSVLGVLLLYAGLFGKRTLLAPLGIIGLLATMVVIRSGWMMNVPLVGAMVRFDHFGSVFGQALTLITVLLFIFGIDYYSRVRENVAEQYALIIFSLVGAVLLISYSNLLVLFLGIEILSIPLYILAGGKRDSFRSGEAAFKYFLQGSFASGFFLMGIALLYGSTASLDLATVQASAASASGSAHMLYL
ncbi:MAG TPA: proton-conducting transporter membrane subunit, partial [Flavobacteriales bacterium]|nr:proton-conducting transporter membrane subunit [Flavobacteriales bacterium]